MKLAVDVGGTFTDLVQYDEATGRMSIVKCPSTPDAFERGVLNAVDLAERAANDERISFIHGSTVVINHLLERKGARTALVTTQGFKDNLDIQRTNRPDLYNLRYRKPKPFVEREHRFEIAERMSAAGEALRAVDESGLADVADRLRAGGYDAVAISLINSYKNPAHEQQIAAYLQERLPGVYIAFSSNVQLWREYERTNTVVSNAYVGPSVSAYLSRLEDGLRDRGIGGERLQPTMMLSNGGRTTFEEAKYWPINLVESGPAAGVTGACVVAERSGIRDFIALDVGGTTAKAALVENGEPQRLQEYTLEPGAKTAGYPLLVPTIDIVEIGAGGGSIVRVAEERAIRVGPDSAGAMPGPACYGRGGKLPSITDANYLSGRLPESLASGLVMDRAAAEQAFAPIVEEVGMAQDDVIRGVLKVAESKMARVIQLATVARGKDPRAYHLIAYGGSAPLHAAEMARDLRLKSVVIPPSAGVFSAWGMVHAPFIVDSSKTLWTSWPDGRDVVTAERDAMLAAAQAKLQGMGREVGKSDAYLEVCYQGQARSLSISAANLDAVHALFVEAHREKYGFVMEAPVEITGISVVVSDETRAAASGGAAGTDNTSNASAGTTGQAASTDASDASGGAAASSGNATSAAAATATATAADADASVAPERDGEASEQPFAQAGQRLAAPAPVSHGVRPVLGADGWRDANLYRRDLLQPGHIVEGPAVVEEETTTTYVPADALLAVDPFYNLVITFRDREDAR